MNKFTTLTLSISLCFAINVCSASNQNSVQIPDTAALSIEPSLENHVPAMTDNDALNSAEIADPSLFNSPIEDSIIPQEPELLGIENSPENADTD